MLAVMEFERFFGDMRLQRVERVRQRGQFVFHDELLADMGWANGGRILAGWTRGVGHSWSVDLDHDFEDSTRAPSEPCASVTSMRSPAATRAASVITCPASSRTRL